MSDISVEVDSLNIESIWIWLWV